MVFLIHRFCSTASCCSNTLRSLCQCSNILSDCFEAIASTSSGETNRGTGKLGLECAFNRKRCRLVRKSISSVASALTSLHLTTGAVEKLMCWPLSINKRLGGVFAKEFPNPEHFSDF